MTAKNAEALANELNARVSDEPECTRARWCAVMRWALESASPRSDKGLSVPVMINFQTGATRTQGPAYRPTGRKQPLMMLSFCPFCGADYRKLFPPKAARRKK